MLKLALQKTPKTTLQTRRLQQTKQGKKLTDVLLLTNIPYSSKFWDPYDFVFKKKKLFVICEYCASNIISGGPLSALTCCVNVRLLLGDKNNIAVNLFSKLGWELGLYYASYDDFHPDILARMYT